MTKFKVKSVAPERQLGAELKRQRESRGWTLAKAERETKILSSHLKAIEQECFCELPEEPARTNFVKKYIQALGNDPELQLLARTKIGRAHCPIHAGHRPPQKVHLAITPRHLGLIGLGVILIAIGTYLGFQIRALRLPPELYLMSPEDGLVIEQPTILVQGQTEESAQVTINNQPIFKEAGGAFETTIDLQQGTNIITVEAKRKHSKKQTIYRTVIFDGHTQFSQSHLIPFNQ